MVDPSQAWKWAAWRRWRTTNAEDHPEMILEKFEVETTALDDTMGAIVNWAKERKVDSIGIVSFGSVDLTMVSPTYDFITSTPHTNWGHTDVVGVLKRAFSAVLIDFDTDVNASALYEVAYGGHGGHGNICSAVYITMGTAVDVGVRTNGNAIRGFMHSEGGHIIVPSEYRDGLQGRVSLPRQLHRAYGGVGLHLRPR